jgi:hypothetical protein
MDVPGVPDSIRREAYLAMLASLGLNPHDLRRLEFCVDGVHAEVFARTPTGGLKIDTHPDRSEDAIATHVLFIPIKDE